MPPSVRVKRSAYSTLGESSNQRASHPLTALFQPPNSAGHSESHAPHSESQQGPSPTTRDWNTSTLPSRRRSSHFGSLVHRHCRKARSFAADRHLLDHDGQHSVDSRTHSTRSRVDSSTTSGPRPRYVALDEEQGGSLTHDGVETGRRGTVLSLTSSMNRDGLNLPDEDDDHHHDDIVEHLDVIDAQVGTVSSLTNAANSIVFPPLSFYSRKPVVILPSNTRPSSPDRPASIHEDSLDRHVEDVLNRPSKFRRTMLGVWSFLKTPMGIITGIYGFLVVFWGAALVFFLGKIINLHNDNTQGFWVEVCSQIMNGLFTVTGIGLIPFRVLDTYRILKIWYYKQRTKRLRKKAGLPQLFDRDDLPDPEYDPNYVHVLTDEEQHDLHRQQVKFHNSQTWYRAHGTETHRAFPINTALLICLLNDGNSIFQILLCATMWGLNRFERPAWSTGILIPASFLCGIFSGVFIWRGGQKTKRTEKVEEMLRAALEQAHTHPDDGASRPASIPPPTDAKAVSMTHDCAEQPLNGVTDSEKLEPSIAEEMVVPLDHTTLEKTS